MSDKVAVVRNYAGAISAYPLPHGYNGDCPPSCEYHRTHQADVGVAGMLDGHGVIMRPAQPVEGAADQQGPEGQEGVLSLPVLISTESVCAHST